VSRRIFVTVTRGMTDKTAVCIYPWEKPILEQIHGGDVAEVTIEEMCSLKGAIKVEKNVHKRQDGIESEAAPNLRAQLEAMSIVPEDEDPANDPAAEYSRLIDKYGLDKDMPLPVVTRVYGEFQSGAFAAALKQELGKRSQAKAARSGKPIEEMSINEVRSALKAAGIEYDQKAKLPELRDLLATATA
jgi:hypothetical protein